MIPVLLTISALAQGAAPKAVYVVTRPVAKMHRQPSLDADVVSQAIFGSNIDVTETKDGWAKVETPDGYAGWTQMADLRETKTPYASNEHAVRVAQLSANIYRVPDVTKHAPIATLPWESRLEVITNKVDEKGRWLVVRLPDATEAYVQSGDVTSDFTPLTTDQMIAVAKKFLGVTYTWGGTSSFGFDCSGFMQMLERQRGVIIPRDASQQVNWDGFVAVPRTELKPGDLLYFGEKPENVTHTGMYIGNGEFIHDTTHEHPKVQISRLDDAPWTTLFVAARRVKP